MIKLRLISIMMFISLDLYMLKTLFELLSLGYLLKQEIGQNSIQKLID